MLRTTTEALEIIRKVMAKENLKTQHLLLLKYPSQWCNYYNAERMYNENEVAWVEKTTLAALGIIESNAKYNKELVKIVSQKKQTEAVSLTDITQFRLYQNYYETSYWVLNERCLKGCIRISVENDKHYIATIDIPKADKDPSLTTDGKWKEIVENEELI